MAGEKKNDKSVVCVVCCKKLLSTNHDFPSGKYEMCICRNRYMCGRLVFHNIWRGKIHDHNDKEEVRRSRDEIAKVLTSLQKYIIILRDLVYFIYEQIYCLMIRD
jgi:hypothetical protein